MIFDVAEADIEIIMFGPPAKERILDRLRHRTGLMDEVCQRLTRKDRANEKRLNLKRPRFQGKRMSRGTLDALEASIRPRNADLGIVTFCHDEYPRKRGAFAPEVVRTVRAPARQKTG